MGCPSYIACWNYGGDCIFENVEDDSDMKEYLTWIRYTVHDYNVNSNKSIYMTLLLCFL